MNYYQHHIGDYKRDTSHLSLLEHGIYRQLIDLYYMEEKAIPKETQWVMRRLSAKTQEEQDAVMDVLNDFFELTEAGYSHRRCDSEIDQYHQKAEKNRENGKKGGRPSKNKPVDNQSDTEAQNPEKPSGLISESESKANETLTNNHKPLTINQSLKDKAPEKSGSGNSGKKFDFSSWPTNPDPKVWAEYQKHRTKLKAGLSQVVVNRLGKEMHRAADMGYSVDEFLTECMFRGWKGGEAGWLTAKNKPLAHSGFAKQNYHEGVAADGSF